MNEALMMELADGRAPEALIGTILKHHPHWEGHIPLEELCDAVNIVEVRTLESDAYEGALVTDSLKQIGAILVREGQHEKRRRFTIAHELGHFLMPHHDGHQRCTSSDMVESRRGTDHQRRESEANRFSAGLLMPKPWFIRELRKLGAVDLSHVQQLSDRFKTSLEAVINRYVELTDDTCAFVFARSGEVRYVRPSRAFPRLKVRGGDRLPEGTLSALPARAPLRTASTWAQIGGGVWLSGERHRDAPLLEQTMHQRNGYQVTLLYLNEGVMEEAEDAAQLQDTWQLRFGRR